MTTPTTYTKHGRETPSQRLARKKQIPSPTFAVDAWQVQQYQGGGQIRVLGTYFQRQAACDAADDLYKQGYTSVKLAHICGVLHEGRFYRTHFHQTKMNDVPAPEKREGQNAAPLDTKGLQPDWPTDTEWPSHLHHLHQTPTENTTTSQEGV